MPGNNSTTEGDPERDAGWLVDAPWLGANAAVFAMTQEVAIQMADVSRLLHVEKLEAEADRWSTFELQARFVGAVNQHDQ